jgi:hypothetical protein
MIAALWHVRAHATLPAAKTAIFWTPAAAQVTMIIPN